MSVETGVSASESGERETYSRYDGDYPQPPVAGDVDVEGGGPASELGVPDVVQGTNQRYREVHRRLLLCQKKLDTTLVGDELLGAMRQCLVNERVVATFAQYTLRAINDSHVCIDMVFMLQFGGDEGVIETRTGTLLRSDFETMEGALAYGWRSFLHGLFGVVLPETTFLPAPEVPQSGKPSGVRANDWVARNIVVSGGVT